MPQGQVRKRAFRPRLGSGEQRTVDFLHDLIEATRSRLPGGLRGFESRQHPALVKLYYDDPHIHYETWLHRSRGKVEMGLHFETRDPSRNAEMLAYFSEELLFLKAALGEGLEAERWDKGWTRVYHTLPLEPLRAEGCARMGERFAALIETLEPLRRSAAEIGLSD